MLLITGLLKGPVLFCWLESVVVCRLSSSSVTVTSRPAAGSVGTRRGNMGGVC